MKFILIGPRSWPKPNAHLTELSLLTPMTKKELVIELIRDLMLDHGIKWSELRTEVELKIPENFPPLPPVPKGYSHWEPRGFEWRPNIPSIYILAAPGDTDWVGINRLCIPLGMPNSFYVEAVK